MHDISADHPQFRLDVAWSLNEAVEDGIGESGCTSLHLADDPVGLRLGGAELDEAAKQRFAAIQEELAALAANAGY